MKLTGGKKPIKIDKATTPGIALADLCSFRLLKAEIYYGN